VTPDDHALKENQERGGYLMSMQFVSGVASYAFFCCDSDFNPPDLKVADFASAKLTSDLDVVSVNHAYILILFDESGIL
jgi:hypothetical protein